MARVRAVLFDTFGTVVNRRAGIAAAVAELTDAVDGSPRPTGTSSRPTSSTWPGS